MNHRDVRERSVPNSRPDSAKVLRLDSPASPTKAGKHGWCGMNVGRGIDEEVVEGLGEPTILSLSVH